MKKFGTMIEFKEYIKKLNERLKKYIPASLLPSEEALYKPLNIFDVPKKEADE